MIGIYCFTNQINGKSYVGQSNNINKRKRDHFYGHKNINNCCYNTKFYQALRKYGFSSFDFKIIEECSIEELSKKEQSWIEKINSFQNGYNSTLGGEDIAHLNAFEVNQKRSNTIKERKVFEGENHPRAKLTNKEVLLIRERYIFGESIVEIYQDYSNQYTLNSFKDLILSGYIGTDKIDKRDIRFTNALFTGEEVRNIRERAKNKESIISIAKDYSDKASYNTIRGIIKGRTYQHCGNL